MRVSESEIRRWEGLRCFCIGGLRRNQKLKPPVNKEEKIQKRIQVVRETITLNMALLRDRHHKQRRSRRQIEAEIKTGR